jgi:CubicO group peptidase (beta-lactamase class C family)
MTTANEPTAAGLGHFPRFPQGRLPDSVDAELQALLDAAVTDGVIRGASAAVIVARSGSWSGGAGVNPNQDDVPITAASVLPTGSVGKTVIAAQILRLVDEGKLSLDDRAADHYPPEFENASYLMNGVRFAEPSASDLRDTTIRQLLGMRSGFTDGRPTAAAPGPTPVYANVNYDVLAAIIDHVAGRRLPEVVGAGVLSTPGLDGLTFETDGERWPHDGHMRADAETMARWGYDLYGGFVLSEASLREMLDFGGDWYGLGVIDFTHPDLPSGGTYDLPSVGHGGSDGDTQVSRLVAFPDEGVVTWVWATVDGVSTDTGFAAIRTLAEDLRDAAQL